MIPEQFASDPQHITAFVTGIATGVAGCYAFMQKIVISMMNTHFSQVIAIKDQQIKSLEARVSALEGG